MGEVFGTKQEQPKHTQSSKIACFCDCHATPFYEHLWCVFFCVKNRGLKVGSFTFSVPVNPHSFRVSRRILRPLLVIQSRSKQKKVDPNEADKLRRSQSLREVFCLKSKDFWLFLFLGKLFCWKYHGWNFDPSCWNFDCLCENYLALDIHISPEVWSFKGYMLEVQIITKPQQVFGCLGYDPAKARHYHRGPMMVCYLFGHPRSKIGTGRLSFRKRHPGAVNEKIVE